MGGKSRKNAGISKYLLELIKNNKVNSYKDLLKEKKEKKEKSILDLDYNEYDTDN